MVMLVAADQRWLDGGQWLWSPVTTTIFSSSSLCRGASLWFPSLFASVSSFFVGSRVFSAASDVLPSLPLLRGGTGGGGLFSFSPMCLFFSSVLPCFPFFLLFLTVVLPAGKTVAAGGDDEVLCSWWCCCGWEEDGELSSVASSVLLLRFLSS